MGIERRVDVPPVGAAIFAAIEPPFGAGKKHVVLLRIHRDATHRRLISESPARTDARPGLAVILAAHNTLTDRANDNCYIFHGFLRRFERPERFERVKY